MMTSSSDQEDIGKATLGDSQGPRQKKTLVRAELRLIVHGETWHPPMLRGDASGRSTKKVQGV